ncbi:interleukin-1 receptor type 1-like [Trichomycterus rosablanca]|uniref:interleukin-1 receptor type 1-like n=1 Tax=Trichomycterus rosablanca TaxID=2290929 RepID=UPI002F352B7F
MTGVFILLAFALFLSMSKSIEQMEKTSTVEGHAVKLFCETDQVSENFTFIWSKENKTIKTSSRIKAQGSSLWILSTVLSDSGLYICRSTNLTLSTEFGVLLSVVTGPCPAPVPVELALPGSNVNLSCTEEYVPTLGQRLQVQWWKECKPTGIQGSDLDLFNVSVSSMANYTCMVTFRYEGKNYTASRTIQLKVLTDEPVEKPRVIQPHNVTLHVKQGKIEVKLECTVFIGLKEESTMETSIYWTVNHNFSEFYSQLQNNLTIEHRKNNQIYGKSTLFISKVLPEFFNVPFLCIVLSPRGSDTGLVWLIQEENTTQTLWIIALLILLAAALGFALLMFFKIDIILSYRQLFGKNKTQEGKLYNSYVAYFPGNGPGPSTAEKLALKIFPEVLEQQHDLKLFIHGRDDSSTEGSITDMTDVLSQSRTVVLILSGSSRADHQEKSLIPLAEGRERLNELLDTEFFTVIIQSGVQVILVESEKNADYSLLPEPIQSIRKKKGVLRWRQTMRPNDRLWKHLRYRMT